MAPKTALGLAISALMEERAKYAFNANLYKSGVVTLDTVKAAKVYARYTAAIDRLKEMLKTAPKSEYYQ